MRTKERTKERTLLTATQRRLKLYYILPGIVAFLRILLTAFILIFCNNDLELRFVQLFPIIIYVISLFRFYKMYKDGVPVISLAIPILAHIIIAYLFTSHLNWFYFLPLVLLDALYLSLRTFKATYAPFEIAGEETENI